MPSYRYSQSADRDLDGIAEYAVLAFDERQARTYREMIDQSARSIAEYPAIERTNTTRQGRVLRKHNVGEHALFYIPQTDGVLIVRVLHLKSDFNRYLDDGF